MKKFFSAIVAMMLAVPTFAQYSSGGFDLSKDNLYYGLRIGVVSANLSGDVDTDAKAGLNLAGVVGLRASNNTPVFVESGLYYTNRGAKNIGYTNLEIPVLIKYGIKATDDIAVLPFFGPVFSYAFSGKTKQPKADLSGNEKVGTFDEKKAWTGGLKRANFDVKLGCGAEYNNLYLEVGYLFGVSNIAKKDDATIHSNGLFANFGVNF